MYQPLPSCITIKQSEIHGLGLFAVEDIPKDTNLGVAHIKIPHSEDIFPQGFCRTPLGGFYNHSSNPNCYLKTRLHYFCNPKSNVRLTTILLELFTVEFIAKDQELTCKYMLYEIKDAN